MRFSIVVPVYNVENYLEKCLLSIAKQDYEDYEVIIVNDGSTDESGRICDEFCTVYEKFSVIHKKNGGLSDARNVGMRNASGDYLVFIDSDDYIRKDLLSAVAIVLNEVAAVDIVSYRRCNFINDEVSNYSETGNIEILNNEEAYKQYLLSKRVTRMAWDKVYRRDLFSEIEFPVGLLAEDYATTCKVLAKANKVILLDKVLYYYNRRSDSITGKNSIKLILDTYHIGIENYEFSNANFPKLRRYAASEYINLLLMIYYKLWNKSYEGLYEGKIISEINKRIRKNIFTITRFRTKSVQLIYFINKNLFLKIIKIHNKRKTYKEIY